MRFIASLRIAWFALLVGTAGWAQEDSGGVFQDVNLDDLTRAVQKLTRRTFLWTEDLGLRQKRVHLVTDEGFADQPEKLLAAYRAALKASGFVLVPTTSEGATVLGIRPAQAGGREPVPEWESGTLPRGRFVTRILSLKHVSPRAAQAALINLATFPQFVLPLEDAGLLLLTDYDHNVARLEKIVRGLDVRKPDVALRVVRLRNALAPVVEEKLGRFLRAIDSGPKPLRAPSPASDPGRVTVFSDERTNKIVVTAPPDRLLLLETIIRELDEATEFETGGIFVTHLRHTNAVDVARTLNAMYRISVDDEGIPSGGGRESVRPGEAVARPTTPAPPPPERNRAEGSLPTIVADARSNAILMVTDRNTHRTLERVIARLDRRQPQVLITVTVVEVTADRAFDLGVELARLSDPEGRTTAVGRTAFDLSQPVLDPEPAIQPLPGPGLLFMAVKDRIGNVPALLRALEAKGKISILDEPEAATNNHGAATMSVKTEVPVPRTTFTGGGAPDGFAQQSFDYESAETTLSISPHISEGGYLRLETSVRIQKFAKLSAGPGAPPQRDSREITTNEILVPDGGTMVIGGIASRDASESVQGIPLLSELPLLGPLFRRVQQEERKRTLYIFLTPHILYDYGFGDYRERTEMRRSRVERLRQAPLGMPAADLERAPDSTFRFSSGRP